MIETESVKIVIRNLIIFTIIICLIHALINFIQVNKTVEKEINSNEGIRISETYMKYLYSDEEIAQYEAEKEKIINETRTKTYIYLAIFEIVLLAVYRCSTATKKGDFKIFCIVKNKIINSLRNIK